MNTIIVPTDFSPVAVNATNYAVNMAMEIQAEILLLHVYEIPVAVTDTPLIMVSVDELRESAEAKLNQAKEDIERVTGNKVTIRIEARLGNIPDEIEALGSKEQPFAVVMGTTGISSFERSLFGSTTLTAVKHLTWPVICVPAGKVYGEGIRKAGLACDFREVKETMPLELIKNFIRRFNASLHVLNVDEDNKQFAADTPEQTEVLYTALEDMQPDYHFIENSDIEKGINEFAEKNNLDLVIAIPKKHKLLGGLFHKSAVKQLVFHSHIPVMCVHEE